MDRQEYLLGIVLSHIWAFLEHKYVFNETFRKNSLFCLKLQFSKLLDLLFTIFVGRTFIRNIYICFFIFLEHKQIFKKLKILIFMESWPKIAFLAPKWAKRASGPPWDPQDQEKYFFGAARIWKHYARKNNFWIISHRKKKLVKGKNRRKLKNQPNSQKTRALKLSRARDFFYRP